MKITYATQTRCVHLPKEVRTLPMRELLNALRDGIRYATVRSLGYDRLNETRSILIDGKDLERYVALAQRRGISLSRFLSVSVILGVKRNAAQKRKTT